MKKLVNIVFNYKTGELQTYLLNVERETPGMYYVGKEGFKKSTENTIQPYGIYYTIKIHSTNKEADELKKVLVEQSKGDIINQLQMQKRHIKKLEEILKEIE